MRSDPGRRFLSLAAMLVTLCAVALGGCEGIRTSDRDLSYVDPESGLDAMRQKKPLLGIGETKRGVWVDPRVSREYEKGHIPGAISLPFQNVSDDHYLLRGYGVIVVYGDDYNDARAVGMSKKLMELGYKNVKTLRGGIRAWKESGYGLEAGPDPEADVANATERR